MYTTQDLGLLEKVAHKKCNPGGMDGYHIACDKKDEEEVVRNKFEQAYCDGLYSRSSLELLQKFQVLEAPELKKQ